MRKRKLSVIPKCVGNLCGMMGRVDVRELIEHLDAGKVGVDFFAKVPRRL